MLRVVFLSTTVLYGCTVIGNDKVGVHNEDALQVFPPPPGMSSPHMGPGYLPGGHQPSPDEIHMRGNGLLERLPPPPSPYGYPRIHEDNAEFYRYVDDFNWYMSYAFVYGIVLNDYAETRGWVASGGTPLCKLAVRDELPPLPEFTSKVDPEVDPSGFEWELVHYIREVKQYYDEAIDAEDTLVETQKRLCMY